ncbi:hypothetical protein LEP1GSC008_2134 [Leptospira kirschneri serovar Bulgarica str. Nikolaevo]|uniref:Uncharacterized protein n=1 Tax=Leptospira kirschneri serovar Bulgarica str. Nikolaevo TaxID=1240687 RepID=M6FFE6_9LEPT|nr:hypothetical protein LEP1GSC008_2134 [Leptospira kirschneri serovar Bulgarica str. Nikolaevo]
MRTQLLASETALSVPFNKLYEGNVMQYFVFRFNIERDP